jgi:hypothetical protein
LPISRAVAGATARSRGRNSETEEDGEADEIEAAPCPGPSRSAVCFRARPAAAASGRKRLCGGPGGGDGCADYAGVVPRTSLYLSSTDTLSPTSELHPLNIAFDQRVALSCSLICTALDDLAPAPLVSAQDMGGMQPEKRASAAHSVAVIPTPRKTQHHPTATTAPQS